MDENNKFYMLCGVAILFSNLGLVIVGTEISGFWYYFTLCSNIFGGGLIIYSVFNEKKELTLKPSKQKEVNK